MLSPDGRPRDRTEPWSPYGVRTSLDRSAFLVDLAAAAERAQLPVEQIHTEYGHDQIEVSLAPDTPVAAADAVAATRIVIGRAAARHGLRISFSPVPFEGEAGNGAHLHLSSGRRRRPAVLRRATGHTACGRQASRRSPGCIDRRCPTFSASTRDRCCRRCGSSPATGPGRRRAGVWRTARPRCDSSRPPPEPRTAPTSSSSSIDPSANPYLAAAASSRQRTARHRPRTRACPPRCPKDPSKVAQPPPTLQTEQRAAIKAIEGSPVAAELLTPEVIEGLVAVRRYEIATFGDLPPAETTQALRLAWSC